MEVGQAGSMEAIATGGNLPYLSVAVTARNDDHGGNLLGRTQAFVNALIGPARRHGLPMELMVVEWNPPGEKPPLVQALRRPQDSGPCQVRIVEVPPEVHRRYQHPEALPLYQMIAKNAGRTPEGEARLFERMAREGIPWLHYHEVRRWALVMQRLQTPMIFNPENWGLADLDLREAVVVPGYRCGLAVARLSTEV